MHTLYINNSYSHRWEEGQGWNWKHNHRESRWKHLVKFRRAWRYTFLLEGQFPVARQWRRRHSGLGSLPAKRPLRQHCKWSPRHSSSTVSWAELAQLPNWMGCETQTTQQPVSTDNLLPKMVDKECSYSSSTKLSLIQQLGWLFIGLLKCTCVYCRAIRVVYTVKKSHAEITNYSDWNNNL